MDDLISRQDAIRLAEQGQIQGFEWQFKKLCTLPSAEPKHKKGKWIKTYRDGFGNLIGYCNQCRVRHPVDNFCANCGAKMRGDTSEDH